MASAEEQAAAAAALTAASLASFPTASSTGMDQPAPLTYPKTNPQIITPPESKKKTPEEQIESMYTE